MKKITLCAVSPEKEAAPSPWIREAHSFQRQADFEEQAPNDPSSSAARYQHAYGSPLPPSLKGALANTCVFVVDDSPTVCKILARLLGGAGACLHEFANAEAVLRWFSEAAVPCYLPKLIYLDLGLPDMDGHELLRHLRTRPELNDTVIIMLTGQQEIISRIQSRVRGANASITKPFQARAFFAQTAEALGLSADEDAFHPSIDMHVCASSAKGDGSWT